MDALGVLTFLFLLFVVGSMWRMAKAEERGIFWIYACSTVVSLIVFGLLSYLKLLQAS